MEKSGEYLAASIECLERLIREEKQNNQPNSSLKIFELHFMLVKSHLQYAAILSHLASHEKALSQAQVSKEKVKDCAKTLKRIGSNLSKSWAGSNLDIILDNFIFEITNRDPTLVQILPIKAKESLKEHRKPSLCQGTQNQAPSMAIAGGQQSAGIIFWKHNPKNNEKYLKKELAKRYGDSFKGKKMNTEWLEEFNIGNIMHLNPITYKDLLQMDLSVQSILKEDKLVELVLVYSCCLFSIATENRFICHKELDSNKKVNELNGPVNPVAKNYQLLQNKNFKQSEVYHFKAIEILCSFVQDCSLLNHFLSSYQKNYTPNLESIEEAENTLEESRREYSDLGHSRTSLQDKDNKRANHRGRYDEFSDYQTELRGKMTKNVKEKTTELNAHNEITKYLMGKVHKKANPLNPKGSPFIESPSSDLFNQPLDWKADKYSQKDSTRNRSPITTAKIEKQGKVKTITKQAVQRILEGIKLNNQGSGNIITIQSFKPVKTASAKVATMFPSKKNSTNLVTFADSQKTSRANSRKSTSTKSKGSTPTQSPAQTSHTDWCQGSQPLNIKIENKDFIAKLMNINIIKIKPDLRNNPCFCKGIKNPASEAAPEHRRTPRGQTISVENKKKENLSKSKSPSAKNKSASDRSNDLLSKRRLSKNKKIGLLPTKVALKSPDSQRFMKEFSKLSLTDRARRPQKDQEADSQNKTNKAEHSHALDTPKRKLFTLIKGIHEGGAAVGNTYSQFKTLTKRLSQTEKLPDSNSITKLGKVADSQGGQMKYEHLTIKPKSRDKNPHKLK